MSESTIGIPCYPMSDVRSFSFMSITLPFGPLTRCLLYDDVVARHNTRGIGNTFLHSLLLQVCKQTTSNPDANSDLRGWQLLLCILAVAFPSDDLIPFIEKHCELLPVGSIPQTYAEYSISVMRKVRPIGRCAEFSRVTLRLEYNTL